MQRRFNLQVNWQKAVIFKQLGSLWRAGKSRLVPQVRAAKTAAERIDLKPSNIRSIQVWNSQVRSKNTTTFTVNYLQLSNFLIYKPCLIDLITFIFILQKISNQYKKLRKNQIFHTTGCKRMFRLAYDRVAYLSLFICNPSPTIGILDIISLSL